MCVVWSAGLKEGVLKFSKASRIKFHSLEQFNWHTLSIRAAKYYFIKALQLYPVSSDQQFFI